MYILLVCVILLLCQIVYENIGSISSLTMEEFGSIITLNTPSITHLAVFSTSYFHIYMSHLLTNVGIYAILAMFLIQVALFIGLLVYRYLVKPEMKKLGFAAPLFAIAWSFHFLLALWGIDTYILYDDFVSTYVGNPNNFFGHLSGFISGVILALLLEKLSDRVDDVSCEE